MAPSTLIEALQSYADDPMWADHAEVNKRIIVATICALTAANDLLVDSSALAVAIDAVCPSNAAIEHASVEWKRVHAALKKFRVTASKATNP